MLVGVALLAVVRQGAEATPTWFTFYGDDPAHQHSWSNLGTSGVAGILGALRARDNKLGGVEGSKTPVVANFDPPHEPHAPLSSSDPTPPWWCTFVEGVVGIDWW